MFNGLDISSFSEVYSYVLPSSGRAELLTSKVFTSVVLHLLGFVLNWLNLSFSFKLLDLCFESSNFRMVFHNHCLELAVLSLNYIIRISFSDLLRSQLIVKYFSSFLLMVQLGLQ